MTRRGDWSKEEAASHTWPKARCLPIRWAFKGLGGFIKELGLTDGSRCSMFIIMRTLSEQMTAFFMANRVQSCPRASSTRGRSAASEVALSLTAWRTLNTVAVCSLRHLSNAWNMSGKSYSCFAKSLLCHMPYSDTGSQSEHKLFCHWHTEDRSKDNTVACRTMTVVSLKCIHADMGLTTSEYRSYQWD